MRFSFLASHGGSSARAIIEAIRAGRLGSSAGIGVLITNNRAAPIHAWCLEHQVPVRHISGKTHPESEDKAVAAALTEADSDWVILSGYMKKIGPQTLASFQGRMLNIHPSLLPKHGGEGLYGDFVHQAVLTAGDSESGATVHWVTENYDQGPIVLQQTVPVLPDDTVASLGQRVRAIEPELYLKALEKLLA